MTTDDEFVANLITEYALKHYGGCVWKVTVGDLREILEAHPALPYSKDSFSHD